MDYRSKKMPSNTATIIMAILDILMGIFFIFLQMDNKPISKENAVYIVIGAIAIFAGVFLIWYVAASSKYKTKENAKAKKRRTNADGNSTKMRVADPSAKCKILLEAEVDGYRICYRRVKTVNELVINGTVYDEKKGLIEFAHNLSAIIDGHLFEAGYDENDMSYISYDKKRIKEKKRLI